MAKRVFTSICRLATCLYDSSTYERTIDGLAVTPSEVKQLTDRGIPVSTPNANMTVPAEGLDNGFYVEPMFRRDMDVNDLWNLQQSTKRKFSKAHHDDVLKYG